MRHKSALFAGVLAGISAPSTVFSEPNYPRLGGTDTSRMRGDVARVGNDFKTVLKREHGKEQKSSKSK